MSSSKNPSASSNASNGKSSGQQQNQQRSGPPSAPNPTPAGARPPTATPTLQGAWAARPPHLTTPAPSATPNLRIDPTPCGHAQPSDGSSSHLQPQAAPFQPGSTTAPPSAPTQSKQDAMPEVSKMSLSSFNNGASKKTDPSGGKAGDDTEEKDKKPPGPSFFDEKYATTSAEGRNGDLLNIRVNRFNITNQWIGDHIYVYSVDFPNVNGHAVRSPEDKRFMIRDLLSAPKPWAAAFAQHRLFTDWNSTLVKKESTADPQDGLPMTIGASVNTFVNVPMQAPPAPGGQQPTPNATVTLTDVLDMRRLIDYCNGGQNADFNFSVYATAFNIMVRHFALSRPEVFVGRNKVFESLPQGQNGYGVQNILPSSLHPRRGFFNSFRPASGGMQLHLNSSSAAFFPSGPLVTFLQAHLRHRFSPNVLQRHLWPEIRGIIRNLKVRYLYTSHNHQAQPNFRSQILQQPPATGRVKRIVGIGVAANQQVFNDGAGASPTVQNHFNSNVLLLATPIQYPNLPVVNTGSSSNAIWIPMELLWIQPDQSLRSTLSDADMTGMGNFARATPMVNLNGIEQRGRQLLGAQFHQQHHVLNISNRMMTVRGRMLPKPSLVYLDRHQPGVSVNIDQNGMANGRWDLRNKRFVTGSNLSKLMAIQIGQAPAVNVGNLRNGFSTYGILSNGQGSTRQNNANALQNAYNSMNPGGVNTILVLLNDKDTNTYAQIKSWGELQAGVNTVCVGPTQAARLQNPGLQANIALKFNAKLGGQNHNLGNATYQVLHQRQAQSQETTIVMGADVTHPGPGSVQYCPSIAAVVASIDENCVSFPGSMRLQASRKEDITDMHAMVLERLDLWHAKNSSLPDKVLFYRDGVSEDQMSLVKSNELSQIRAACAAAGVKYHQQGYRPPVTLVVCTKRHQTRFYPPANLGTQRTHHTPDGNFRPGLVVDDRRIRLPKYFDFWLQAQKPLGGTARPCHYFVLENEMQFTPDALQEVTYALSWVYATALTPISLAAPTYYADKLCERGRCYIRPLLLASHPSRPNDLAMQQIITATPTNHTNATEDEKKDWVAQHFSTHNTFWPRASPNPCHPRVRDTMFYI